MIGSEFGYFGRLDHTCNWRNQLPGDPPVNVILSRMESRIMLLVSYEEKAKRRVIECLRADVFADGFVMRRRARLFMRQTVIVLSVVEPPALRSSRGSAWRGRSSESSVVTRRGLDLLRRGRGVSVRSAARS